jgi:hypothetical protein
MDRLEAFFFGFGISRCLVPNKANDDVVWILRKLPNELELLIHISSHHRMVLGINVVTDSKATTGSSDQIRSHNLGC